MNASMRRALLVLCVMLCSSALASHFTPGLKLAHTRRSQVDLFTAIPEAFGSWRSGMTFSTPLGDPEQQALTEKLYSQLLRRRYVDEQGRAVMLTIAYGDDQRRGTSVHYPEICYPAQGYEILSSRDHELDTPTGNIQVRRLETVKDRERYEPVTYWSTVGNESTLGGTTKRLIELRYGLSGLIPDGLLFRVSSIGADSEVEFALQERFVRDLLRHVTPESREFLAGLR